jgi:hypothetical protein
MSKTIDPKSKGKKKPAERRTGNAAQRNKDDSTAPGDDGSKGD